MERAQLIYRAGSRVAVGGQLQLHFGGQGYPFGVPDAIFGTKVYLCPRKKIGEIYEKVHVFSDGPAAVGGLFERSFDGA